MWEVVWGFGMKRERHEVVVELINKYDIETQEELAAYLRKEGFDVTQALSLIHISEPTRRSV